MTRWSSYFGTLSTIQIQLPLQSLYRVPYDVRCMSIYPCVSGAAIFHSALRRNVTSQLHYCAYIPLVPFQRKVTSLNKNSSHGQLTSHTGVVLHDFFVWTPIDAPCEWAIFHPCSNTASFPIIIWLQWKRLTNAFVRCATSARTQLSFGGAHVGTHTAIRTLCRFMWTQDFQLPRGR